MDNEWQQSFDSIKTKHDLAYKTIVVAKRYDTAANHELAIVNYKISIKLIDDALLTPVALPDDPSALENDQSWSIALEMIKKMKRTRAELMQRIGHLSQQSNQTIEDEIEVNDFDGDTVAVDAQQRPRTFMELAEALQNLEYNSAVLPNVLELLFSCDGVILYHINANGDVSTTDESSTLRIVRLDQDLKQNFEATYFMQIIRSSAVEQIKQQLPLADSEQEEKKDDDQCVTVTAQASSENASQSSELTDGREVSSIIYPLVAGVSPCFRTDFGAFIFPDLEAEVPGSAFGFVITSGHDEIVLEVLEAILHGVVRQGQAPAADEEEEYEGEGRARQVRQSSEVISENIIKGACIISNGLVKGSEQVGKFVSFTTPYIISKMNKAPPTTVPSKVVGGVEIAKSATSKAVSVTGYVAGKVGTATMALGRFLAPHVHCQGSKLLSSAMGISNDEAANKVNYPNGIK